MRNPELIRDCELKEIATLTSAGIAEDKAIKMVAINWAIDEHTEDMENGISRFSTELMQFIAFGLDVHVVGNDYSLKSLIAMIEGEE